MNIDSPDTLIILAGTNDLAYAFRNNEDPDVDSIATSIINTGRYAREKGVKTIYINSIIVRRGYRYKYPRTRLNNIIRAKCEELGFFYIDNEGIRMDDLCEDGLHLNEFGTEKLRTNFLKCFHSYNPYLYHN